MRKPKKVRLTRQPEGFSRKELARQFDVEIHQRLEALGITSRHPTIDTGSSIVDSRIKTQIGDYKGDPTVGMWHGQRTGAIIYESREIEL